MFALRLLLLTTTSAIGEVPEGLFSERVEERRGKILAVVTSVGTNPNTGKTTGYELTELSRAYYVFEANGFEVDIASPLGGKAPAVFDEDDMTRVDYAFIEDPAIKEKLDNTLSIHEVDPAQYRGIYFVGGKGTFFDFPENRAIQEVTASIYANNGVVSGVCHGPAALLNVRRPDGSYLLDGIKVSSFTNDEELFFNRKAKTYYPFLLEDELKKRGATFEKAGIFLSQTTIDGRLVTGQNPWSTWSVAEGLVQAMGYQPVNRKKNALEQTLDTIAVLNRHGMDQAIVARESSMGFHNGVLGVYTVFALLDGNIGSALNLIRLSDYTTAWILTIVSMMALTCLAWRLAKAVVLKLVRTFSRQKKMKPVPT